MKLFLGIGLAILLIYIISTRLFGKAKDLPANWINLTEMSQLDSLVKTSKTKPVIIYKHSTQCGVCTVTYRRLKNGSQKFEGKTDFYYLDLLRYRSISNKIAEIFVVKHESPQILIIKNGQAIYNEDHYKIEVDKLTEYF